MKNGGVAILGKAEVEGEDRAQRAIEEALSSPLLNDNDIKGAKWILININSAEGDDECTMDELEVINSFLRMQAGENTDVIVGTGYDNSLGAKIGITLIATGFDAKDPFAKPAIEKKAEPKPEKIVMTLGFDTEEKIADEKLVIAKQEMPIVTVDPFAPTMVETKVETTVTSSTFNTDYFSTTTPHNVELPSEVVEETSTLRFELSTEITAEVVAPKFNIQEENTVTASNDNNQQDENTDRRLRDRRLSV
nr:cell division protein FtsZ [Chitinophagaceae bacterium]